MNITALIKYYESVCNMIGKLPRLHLQSEQQHRRALLLVSV